MFHGILATGEEWGRAGRRGVGDSELRRKRGRGGRESYDEGVVVVKMKPIVVSTLPTLCV